MVSEFPPAGIVGLGLSVSTILLEIVLGDGPATSLMSYPASSSSGHKNTQIKELELVSSFRRHLGCCSRLKILKVRLIFTC